ncbi:MAG: ArsR family transcriptional regulator [Candidatus Abyssobacteria bacterium SURF_5]|uniref:ArsR family transcriptional regulator n=1 Tax=Abyssobacteria bacterium (strain SURF_5) TaxID=2093360 RepID=A0A3A4NFB9_ABYX5|nr:MAG: ArsR family transcriptional regulator [Candidatus Abyssubacteria bacterium SURF_5]
MKQDELVKIFKALGNENRLKLLEAIRKYQSRYACCPKDFESIELKPGSICCVDEITGQFDMAQSTISQHLKELHNAGLLERNKRAQWVYYTINQKKLEELADYLNALVVDLARKA